jgi:hypothetical protein
MYLLSSQEIIVQFQDTAFYECRATNGRDTIRSVAIITVKLGKVNLGGDRGPGGHNDDSAGFQ